MACVQLLYSAFVSVAGGCLTVTGRTLAENLKGVQPPGVEQVCTGLSAHNSLESHAYLIITCS